MEKRLILDEILRKAPNTEQVYFATENQSNMTYPCIRYELSRRNYVSANDKKYLKFSNYTVFYVTRSPSDSIPVIEYLESLNYCVFDRTYVTDGLYHYVFSISL